MKRNTQFARIKSPFACLARDFPRLFARRRLVLRGICHDRGAQQAVIYLRFARAQNLVQTGNTGATRLQLISDDLSRTEERNLSKVY
jgi:hypothetical protein